MYLHVCVFLCVQLREELEFKEKEVEKVSIYALKHTHTHSHFKLLKGRDWPICMPICGWVCVCQRTAALEGTKVVLKEQREVNTHTHTLTLSASTHTVCLLRELEQVLTMNGVWMLMRLCLCVSLCVF